MKLVRKIMKIALKSCSFRLILHYNGANSGKILTSGGAELRNKWCFCNFGDNFLEMEESAITLLEFNRRVNRLLHDVSVQRCWVVAETSDVMLRNHCYMELVQKNPVTGLTEAKARAIIWASRFAVLRNMFEAATGQAFGNGLKVMVEVSANFHEQFGYSLVITDINPTYTIGDMARQRMEIISRLRREGLIGLNKELDMPAVPQRIAVVSAGTAAGYGDFMEQLHGNASGLKFYTCLFPAVMQGVNTPASIISALNRIYENAELFDCVVIIRGGGATSELNAFDNYDLAANVAQFPLPVIVGIGHDRDTTVLDEVANVRVKTPTAAAEWLVGRAQSALDTLNAVSDMIVDMASEMIASARQQLAYYTGTIPLVAENIVTRNKALLQNYVSAIPLRAHLRIETAGKDLGAWKERVAVAASQCVAREKMRLQALDKQVELLSPERVLRRGYSLTVANGHVVTDAAELAKGDILETRFASGRVVSEVK